MLCARPAVSTEIMQIKSLSQCLACNKHPYSHHNHPQQWQH